MTQPWPGMPGGIQLGWGLAELEREDAIAQRGDADPHPEQPCLPGLGVLPGRMWRRSSAPTGLEGKPTKQLDVWRHHIATRPKRRRWTDRDVAYKTEILARSVDVWTAYGWRNGAPSPAWFDGLVPRKLRPIVSLLWAAYTRNTYGVADRQAELAAKFDATRKTIGNWVREGEELGLVRKERLWREKSVGAREWDICLYRLGPLLEVLGGVAAFEHRRPPRAGLWMRVAWPGALPRLRVTQDLASERAVALREASRRVTFEATGEVWADRAKLHAGPELFLAHLADVLASAPRPRPAVVEHDAAIAPAASSDDNRDDNLTNSEPEIGLTIAPAASSDDNLTNSEPEIGSEILPETSDLLADAAIAGNGFAADFLAAVAQSERTKRKKVPSTPLSSPPLREGRGSYEGEPGAPRGEDDRRCAAGPIFAPSRSTPSAAAARVEAPSPADPTPAPLPPSRQRTRPSALGGGLQQGARRDATTAVLSAVRELADPELAERLAGALPKASSRLSPERRRELLAELQQGEPDPWAYSPTEDEYFAQRRSKRSSSSPPVPPPSEPDHS